MNENAHGKQQEIVAEFGKLAGWEERYKHLIKRGQGLSPLDSSLYQDKFLVKGCQSQVWLHAQLNQGGKMILQGDSDALIVKGLVSLVLGAYSGLTPQEILGAPPHFIKEMGLEEALSPSRANGFLAMIKQVMLYAQAFSLQA